jgi:hypothetical protein
VLLTVASNGGVEAEDGVTTAGLTVVCGADTGGSALFAGRSQTVGQWRDGGVREGAVRCRLGGPAAPGHYWLPVRFAVVLD